MVIRAVRHFRIAGPESNRHWFVIMSHAPHRDGLPCIIIDA